MGLRGLGKELLKKSGRGLLTALDKAAEAIEPRQAAVPQGTPSPSPSQERSGTASSSAFNLGDAGKPAQLYGRGSCPWTGRARRVFEEEQADYEFIDLDAPESGLLTDQLIAETRQNTVPYVFLRGRFIGGFNALDEVARLGQLRTLMMTPEERARQPSRIAIEIAGRPPSDRS